MDFSGWLASADRWITDQTRRGWTSCEVERLACRVRCGLWVCANNDPPHWIVLDMLLEDARALARLRAHQNKKP